ncbi:hypothetical protein H4R35_006135 [Dimargaris xerosporica]|nr:hypothetical protein H4R35_006135 [Dimargaris xerosporica]
MPAYTYLAVLAMLVLLPGQSAFTANTVRIEDGQGHCITQAPPGTVEGAPATLDDCSSLYPDTQVVVLNPHPSNKAKLSIVVEGNQCVSVIDKVTDNHRNVTYAPCADDERQYFLASNQDNKVSFKSKKYADKFLQPLNGILVVAPKVKDNDYPWQLFRVGGGVCSSEIYDSFLKSNTSMIGLMREIGLSADKLLQTIDGNGIPSLQESDRNILKYCDTQMQQLFNDFDRDLTNMFTKAGQFKGTYRTQIRDAVSEVVQALQEDKLALGKTSSKLGHRFLYFLTNSVVGPLLDKSIFGNTITSALKTWSVFSNKQKVMTENPQKNIMVDEVGTVFDKTSSELFKNLRYLINNSTYAEYKRYADDFATKSVDEIYGNPTELTHKVKLQTIQYLANVNGTLSNQLCLIGQHGAFKTRQSDYQEQGDHFILKFPTHIKELTMDSLNATNQVTDMLGGKAGWNLKLVDDTGFFVRKDCNSKATSYEEFYKSKKA